MEARPTSAAGGVFLAVEFGALPSPGVIPIPFTAFTMHVRGPNVLGKSDAESWTNQQVSNELDPEALLAVPPMARPKPQRLGLVGHLPTGGHLLHPEQRPQLVTNLTIGLADGASL